jgi:methanogenic corrinoid protein MtbC1
VNGTDRSTSPERPALGALTDQLPIGRVSEIVGVPAATIRSWERRYGLAVGTRSPHGHRRYSVLDVAALERVRDEVAGGRGTAEAAALVNAASTATPTELCTALLAATSRFDPDALVEVLDRATWLHGLPRTVDEVLFPALREIGSRWVQRAWDVAHEHLTTTTVQGWLRAREQEHRRSNGHGAVVLCCGPDEQHTLGLDALAALLAQDGVPTLNLGARTPVASVRATLKRVDAAAVVVSCHMSSGRAATLASLQAAQETVPRTYYAGAAFRTSSTRQGVPGHYLGSNLGRAAGQVAARTVAA